ncbi:MAG: acyl carrier protein [Patescibacteria group bacterium]
MNKPVPKSFERLREVLSEMTGNDASEIHLDSHLEEDLGFNLDEDFSRLLRKIDDEFSVSLDYEDSLNELTDAGETVIELAKLIDNELELG